MIQKKRNPTVVPIPSGVLRNEGFIATHTAITMESDYLKDIFLPSLPHPQTWKVYLDSRTKLLNNSASSLLFTCMADQVSPLLTTQDTRTLSAKVESNIKSPLLLFSSPF